MEDQKITDKRKAPDKSGTLDLSDSDSSLIEQKPLKRPRLADSTRGDESLDTLGQTGETTVPRVDDGDTPSQLQVESSKVNAYDKLDVDEGLEGNISSGVQPMDISLRNGSSSKEELETMDKGYVHEVEISLGDGDNNNDVPPEHINVLKMDEGKLSSENNGDHSSSPNVDSGKSGKTGSGMESSPLSDDKVTPPPLEVNIDMKAFDSKTGKLVFEDRSIRSDYSKLETFLNQHGLGLTQSSFNSGYMGDVDSEDRMFPVPRQTAGYNRKSRWTSSTLGSSIPRESIKTVYTVSPNDSPNDSPSDEVVPKPKKRGKNEPKVTSTRLSEDKSPPVSEKKSRGSDKLEKMFVSNGETPSNGLETPPAKIKRVSSSSGSKSSTKKSSKSSETAISITRKSNKSGSVVSGDKHANTPKTPSTPKSRTVSRELSRNPDSPFSITALVEPLPTRAVAIVEGGAAKPLTKFEQEVNNEPVDLSLLKHSKTLWGSVATNHQVFARWRDKNYYSGFIKEKGMNDTWIIDFDDATTYAASEGHIIPIKILGVGIKGVYCPDTGYHPADAVILGQKFVNDSEIGETVKYAIKLTNGENGGQVLWCTRRMLSIKENDARILRQEFQPTPKVLKAAEVSLENIIPESSRRRTATSLTKLSTPQPTTPKTPISKKIVGGAFDASTSTITDGSHNEPKPTPKRKTPKSKPRKKANETSTSSGNNRPSRGHTTTSMSSNDLSGHEKSSKESPKKTKLKDKHENNSVFAGYQFFLTASGGGDPASLGSNSGPQVPYDKDEYRDLIERKGGKIVESVGQEQGRDKIFLVSDNYARTVKYIYSLAASIPCVSHKWIQECITQGKIVSWDSYELNAGWSLESNKVIPAHKKKPLEGFEIYITAGSNDLYDYWKPVLTVSGAKLLKPKRVKGKIVEDDIPKEAQVLVTDATCSSEVLAKAHERMIPVVKPEWLVQSIIAGNRADFFNHEKYRVEILEPDDYEDDEEDDDDEDDEDQS